MELSQLTTDVIPSLLSGNAELAAATAEKYFSKDAVFKHPLFLVEGREEVKRLYAFWNNSNRAMYPRSPGTTQMWIDKEGKSVVLDFTYSVTPIYDILGMRHRARLVVLLHLVESEKQTAAGKPLYLIRYQEDLLELETLVSAILSENLSWFIIMILRWMTRASGLFSIYVLGPIMYFIRALFG